MSKIPTDNLTYEVVMLDKRGLYRRDGLLYQGIRCATRQATLLRKHGHDVRVLPYRPIHEPALMRLAVA